MFLNIIKLLTTHFTVFKRFVFLDRFLKPPRRDGGVWIFNTGIFGKINIFGNCPVSWYFRTCRTMPNMSKHQKYIEPVFIDKYQKYVIPIIIIGVYQSSIDTKIRYPDISKNRNYQYLVLTRRYW